MVNRWPFCHSVIGQHPSSPFLCCCSLGIPEYMAASNLALWSLREMLRELLTQAGPILSSIRSWLWAQGGSRLLWKFTGYTWPSGCAVTFLFKAVLGKAWSWPASFVLTWDTTGCESLSLTGGAGQDELAALGSGAEFILVPWGSTVWTFWGRKNNLCYKHTHAHALLQFLNITLSSLESNISCCIWGRFLNSKSPIF